MLGIPLGPVRAPETRHLGIEAVSGSRAVGEARGKNGTSSLTSCMLFHEVDIAGARKPPGRDQLG